MLDRGLGTDAAIRGSRTRRAARISKGAGSHLFDAGNALFFVLFAATILYPFWYTIILSLSGFNDVTSLGFHLWVEEVKLDAWRHIARDRQIPIGYGNSIFRTLVGTVLTLIVTLGIAFPLAKKDLPFRKLITLYLLITMFFGGGLIPTFLLIRRLGLFDSRWVYILPVLVGAFNVIIVRNFLMTIDAAFEESAMMDGANYLQVLVHVIAPLAKPVLAVIALWTAVEHWNAWFDNMLYVRDRSKYVLQMVLRNLLIQEWMTLQNIQKGFIQQGGKGLLPPESVKAATVLVTLGPIVLVYPYLQRYFVKGIFLGSLKG